MKSFSWILELFYIFAQKKTDLVIVIKYIKKMDNNKMYVLINIGDKHGLLF